MATVGGQTVFDLSIDNAMSQLRLSEAEQFLVCRMMVLCLYGDF